MAKRKIIITTNLYLTPKKSSSAFDHPLAVRNFSYELEKGYLKSVQKLKVPQDIDLILNFLIAGVRKLNPDFKKKIIDYFKPYYQYRKIRLFFPEQISGLKKQLKDKEIIGIENYCAIRNTAFILAFLQKADLLIQIDSDESLPPEYVTEAIKIAKKHKLSAFGGFYLEEGRPLSPLFDPLDFWPKFSSMSVDYSRVMASEKPIPTIYGKGGNMVFLKSYYSRICYPKFVPRGEDTALGLRSWLVYYNGNSLAKIKAGDKTFRFHLSSSPKLMITHHTEHRSIQSFLPYLEKNLIRFAIERNTFQHQKKFTKDKLYSQATYISRMLLIENYEAFVNHIYDECQNSCSLSAPLSKNPVYLAMKGLSKKPSHYPRYKTEEIEASRKRVLRFCRGLRQKNLWQEYKKYQLKYLNLIKTLSSQKPSLLSKIEL